MVAFLGHVSPSIRIKYPWNASRFQPRISLIELRPRGNSRFAVGRRSFKDTSEIHFIMPLAAVTNRWTSSVTTGQDSLPYKSIFLINMLKTFPLCFAQIARLVRMGNNSRNAFHEETIRIETVSEQPPHWPIISPRYLKVDSTWKLSFPMLTYLKYA